jgi:tetratricopeptide (TPR) repeat protein
MRKLTGQVRALTVAVSLALGTVAVAALPFVAEAQQKKLDVRPEVRKKVVAAQEAANKGNFGETIRLLKDAKSSGPLKSDEEYAVNELLIYAANSAQDYRLLAQTIEERLSSGRVGDRLQKLNLLANTYYTLNDLPKAEEATQRLIQARGSASADDLQLLGTIQFQRKNYRAAAPTLSRAADAAARAGKSAKTQGQLLEMLNAAYFNIGDNAARIATLNRLFAVTPKSDVFGQLVTAYTKSTGGDRVAMLNLYRLGAAKGVLSKDHWPKFVDAALDLSSPGEAATALDKGMASGGIKKDDRNLRMAGEAKKQTEALKASLPQREREARALATGEADVKLAVSYFSVGDYAKAVEAAKRGIGKGKVKSLDDANFVLGIASLKLKKSADAKAAFSAAGEANPKVKDVADLWAAVGA